MRKIIIWFLAIFVINLLLHVWVLRFNSLLPLSKNYWGNHHYYQDERTTGGEFNLLRAWGQTDAQWYLKIASEGYGQVLDFDSSKDNLTGLGYAFFPLYPMLIRFAAQFTGKNYELAAFILNNTIIFIDWFCILFVIKKIYSLKPALWTSALIVLFPFSLFLRSYHTEGLYLLELTWWLYFITRKKMLPAASVLALMNVTKGTGWFINLIFYYYLYKEYKKKHIKVARAFFYAMIPVWTILIWMAGVFIKTGNPFFFYTAVSQWKLPGLPAPVYNILKFGLVGRYIVEGSWTNVFQTFVFVVSVLLLVKSRKILKPAWWWTSFLLLAIPTLTTYSVGFTSGRLAVVQLPLWFFLASRLGNKTFKILIITFIALLFWGSLYFINWYWWG